MHTYIHTYIHIHTYVYRLEEMLDFASYFLNALILVLNFINFG